MAKVKIVRLGAMNNRKPLGEVGDVIDVPEDWTHGLVFGGYAKPVEGMPEHKPEETATDPNAEERETRDLTTEVDDQDENGSPAPSAKEIRAWANDNNIDVPARGAIPEKVRDAYAVAHNG